MDPPPPTPPILVPIEHSFSAPSHYISHQPYEPYGNYVPPNVGLQAHPQYRYVPVGQRDIPTTINPSPTPRIHSNHGAEDVGGMSELSMGPPNRPRKRKAPTLRAEDWEPYKDRIIELHNTQGLSLKDVKEAIEEEYGFHAEIRQYRTRVSQWGKDKNIKPKEMQAIVRKQQKRKLVEVDKRDLKFTVRGSTVEPQKIERWMKRRNVGETYAPSPAASTPSAIYCRTISEGGSPPFSSVYSPGTPSSSPRSMTSHSPIPEVASTALSLPSIVRPTSSEFTGQSPVAVDPFHLYLRPIPIPSTMDPGAPTTHRYRQADENNLREELSRTGNYFGKGHSKTLDILFELAYVLIDQGRYKSAEEAIRSLVERRINLHGDEHVDTLRALGLLMRVLYLQGLYAEAEVVQRTLEPMKAALGELHPDVLKSKQNLALTYLGQRRYKEAEELLVQVVEMEKRVLGEEHPDALTSMNILASVYLYQERYKEAEELLVQVVEVEKRMLGEEHPDTLMSKSNLAVMYRGQKRYKKVEELLMQVVEVEKRMLGEEHPDTLMSKSNLVVTYLDQKRYKEAEELSMQVAVISIRVPEGEHPYMRRLLEDLEYASGMHSRFRRRHLF